MGALWVGLVGGPCGWALWVGVVGAGSLVWVVGGVLGTSARMCLVDQATARGWLAGVSAQVRACAWLGWIRGRYNLLFIFFNLFSSET